MYTKLPKHTPHQQYANVQVSTIDRGKLLVMLFDGCVRFLAGARSALRQNNLRRFSKCLSKAQAIISELMVTLDHDKGGDIARDLERLYDFMLFHLTEANIQKDVTKVQEVLDLMTTIAEAYRQIIEKGDYKAQLEAMPAAPSAPAPDEAAKKPLGQSSLGALPGKGLSVSF